MTYGKPEAAILGDAARLIQGLKDAAGDGGNLEVPITQDCELID
jgi:hypothetical protein